MPPERKIRIIGELINNAYKRARLAWQSRDLGGYQELALLQDKGGAEIINLNVDGTQQLSVRLEEMLDFLPKVIPAIQEVTDIAISFDNPHLDYHKAALGAFDRSKCRGKPVLNSLAASRKDLDGMIALIKEHDMRCIVMASEKFADEGGGGQSLSAQDSYETVVRFAEMLSDKADRQMDDIIVDPGLAPVGADTYGIVNMGLDTMSLCREDPNLRGLHFSVGLSNFAWGTPRHVRDLLERAYLTLGARVGLDMALANVERNADPLPDDHELVARLDQILQEGRPQAGESVEDAGFRQAELIMELCMEYGKS